MYFVFKLSFLLHRVAIGVFAKGAGGWQPPQFQIIRAKRQKIRANRAFFDDVFF